MPPTRIALTTAMSGLKYVGAGTPLPQAEAAESLIITTDAKTCTILSILNDQHSHGEFSS